MEMMVFSPAWFEKHQKKLLWFCNTRFGRWILCINGEKSSVGCHVITKILPHAIEWQTQKPGEYQIEFRTHAKFAKRLYYAFRPFWYLLHFLDWVVFDRYAWAKWLSFGFSTLTVYPNAGDPGTTSCDGSVRRDGVAEAFGTIRAGAGTAFDQTSATMQAGCTAHTVSNQYTDLNRIITLFDTSALEDTAVISAATQSAWGFGKANGLGAADFCLVNTTPASNTDLANADYGQVGSTEYASRITYASAVFNNTQYNDMAMNATGIAAISKTGVTKTGYRFSYDLDGSGITWSSGAETRYTMRSADQTGTSNDPKLVITYSTSTAYNQSCNETVTTVDGKTSGITRALGEVVTMVEAFLATPEKILNEVVTVVDSLTSALSKNFQEVITVVDNVAKGATRAVGEVITVVANFTQGPGKILREVFSVTDNILKYLNGLLVGRWTPRDRHDTTWTPQDRNE